MPEVIFDGVVDTDYGQLDLVWHADGGFDGDWDRFFDGQVNGLAGAASGDAVYVNLARRSGGSSVRIVRHDAEPAISPTAEDVVEVSVTIPSGADVVWSSWGSESSGPLSLAPNTYRVRVSAWGRDAGRDGELADGLVDWYVIDLWHAAPRPDEIVRTTSADAAYWHEEIGSRRP